MNMPIYIYICNCVEDIFYDYFGFDTGPVIIIMRRIFVPRRDEVTVEEIK